MRWDFSDLVRAERFGGQVRSIHPAVLPHALLADFTIAEIETLNTTFMHFLGGLGMGIGAVPRCHDAISGMSNILFVDHEVLGIGEPLGGTS